LSAAQNHADPRSIDTLEERYQVRNTQSLFQFGQDRSNVIEVQLGQGLQVANIFEILRAASENFRDDQILRGCDRDFELANFYVFQT